MATKVKTKAVAREVEKTDDKGEKYMVLQNLVEVGVCVRSVEAAVSALQRICQVVYPLGNSWVKEVTAAADWEDLCEQFKKLALREPENADMRPEICVDGSFITYETGSKTASVAIEQRGFGFIVVKATVWQPNKHVSPLLNAAKVQGLEAAVRREEVA